MKGAWRPARPVVRPEQPPEKRPEGLSPKALELMVERAWLSLPRAGTARAPAAVYLTPTNVIVGTTLLVSGVGTLVGFYDQRVTLGFFREDVFEVNERIRGRG